MLNEVLVTVLPYIDSLLLPNEVLVIVLPYIDGLLLSNEVLVIVLPYIRVTGDWTKFPNDDKSFVFTVSDSIVISILLNDCIWAVGGFQLDQLRYLYLCDISVGR